MGIHRRIMKRYKIDFNNGKVFESVRELGDSITFFAIAEDGSRQVFAYDPERLKVLGATITEIKTRQEFFICWDDNTGKYAFEPENPRHKYSWENKIKALVLKDDETIVSREILSDVLHKMGASFYLDVFEEFCKELGLE